MKRPIQTQRSKREQGVALIMVLAMISIMAIVLTELHETTITHSIIAVGQRDRLRAEYMAKSGINITRLLIGNEPAIRAVVAPLYQGFVGRPPPQLPVWSMANLIVEPFCDLSSKEDTADFSISNERKASYEASCQVRAFSENSRINVNRPLLRAGDEARLSVAQQLYTQFGGYMRPSPFDPIFQEQDPDGLNSSRLDIISSIIDWWDPDSERTTFDPGASTVQRSGAEDDVYSRFEPRYVIKNAPFDSLEELRLVRGMSDDLWATFVQPSPDDIGSRKLTIYGSGSVNPNEAPAEVLLARLCSYIPQTTLCADMQEQAKFVQLVRTARVMFPIPFFSKPEDFLNFIQGRGNEKDLYPTLLGFLGEGHPLLFAPVIIPQDKMQALNDAFVVSAKIFTIHVTGTAGRASARITTVMNFHERWTPPPPNAGSMPALGIFHYYRME